MKRSDVHLVRGALLVSVPSASYCGTKIYAESTSPRRTTFPTEATCLRCLQLAVVDYEKKYMEAKYYDADGNHKEVNHGSLET